MRITKQRVVAALALAGGGAVLVLAWPHVKAYLEETRLIRQLGSENIGDREKAAAELAKRRSLRAIPALLRLAPPEWVGSGLEPGNASEYAHSALEQILEAEPVRAFRALERCLEDEDVIIRREAARRLYGGGPWMVEALPSLLEALRDTDPAVRVRVAYPLWQLGVDAKVLAPVLVDALNEENVEADQAARLLGLLGEEADGEAVPALAKRVRNAKKTYFRHAWSALARLGTAGAQALAGLLTDSDSRVRVEAASQLEQMGPAAAPAIGAFTQALNGENEKMRRWAIDALGAMGPTAHDAVSELLGLLQGTEDDKDAEAAVEALGEIGVEAEAALPALLMAVVAEDGDIAATAAKAIGKMCPEPAQALPVLVKALDDPRDEVRLAAMEALARLGPDARPVFGYIADHFHDESYRVRAWAAAAVVAMGKDSEDTYLPQLISMVGVYEEYLSDTSLRILELLGPLARRAAPKLVEFVLRPPEGFRVSFHERHRSMTELDRAALALAQVGVTATDLRPAVLALKENEKRRQALDLLTELGPAAAVVLPELVEALDDSDVDVREDAVRVLKSIGPAAGPAIPN